MRYVQRGGPYYRVCDPTWRNCGNTEPGKLKGGRWNPPGAFGVLYLNRTVELAAAQARHNYEDEIHTLFDLLPEERPDLQDFEVPEREFVDAVTDEGLQALGLPPAYPQGVGHDVCQPIGLSAYKGGEHGISCRSAVDATGEELALFDRDGQPARPSTRRRFADWYPTS